MWTLGRNSTVVIGPTVISHRTRAVIFRVDDRKRWRNLAPMPWTFEFHRWYSVLTPRQPHVRTTLEYSLFFRAGSRELEFIIQHPSPSCLVESSSGLRLQLLLAHAFNRTVGWRHITSQAGSYLKSSHVSKKISSRRLLFHWRPDPKSARNWCINLANCRRM